VSLFVKNNKNMENKTWIKVYRKIKEKAWYKRSAYVHLWLHILIKAEHSEKEFLWNGQTQKTKRGQFLTGRKALSKDTGIPQSSVEDILNLFVKDGQIRQDKTSKFRLITVLNYAEYQTAQQQPDIKPTSKQQQADIKPTHNKNTKNSKNKKNNKDLITSDASVAENKDIGLVIKIFEVVNPSYQKMFANTTQRQACERLLKKWSVAQIRAVVENVLPKLNADQYAKGKSITPLQLEDNLGYIKAYIDSQKNIKQERNVTII
jgi:hypothetical protein